MTRKELIEALAAAEHDSWARWMRYFLSQGERDVMPGNPDDLLYDSAYVASLQRQIEAPYADLSEQEKQYDREEVAHILPIIEAYRRAALEEVQEFIVAHCWDTSVGHRIDDFINERLRESQKGE